MSLLTAEDYVNFPVIKADHRIFYGTGEHHFADLYLPAGSPKAPYPTITLIHGGCWRAQYNLDGLGAFARAFNKLGVAVYSLEYRRVGHEGREWQHTFEDVAAGADNLRHIARIHKLDLNRVIVMGHSAGGHLALWLAARKNLAETSPLYSEDPIEFIGVVSLAGIANLATALADGICQETISELLLGTPNEFPQRYADASPSENLPLGIPQILINGTEDTAVPASHIQPYAALAKAAGDSVRVELLEGVGHFEIVSPETDAFATVAAAARVLFATRS